MHQHARVNMHFCTLQANAATEYVRSTHAVHRAPSRNNVETVSHAGVPYAAAPLAVVKFEACHSFELAAQCAAAS